MVIRLVQAIFTMPLVNVHFFTGVRRPSLDVVNIWDWTK